MVDGEEGEGRQGLVISIKSDLSWLHCLNFLTQLIHDHSDNQRLLHKIGVPSPQTSKEPGR